MLSRRVTVSYINLQIIIIHCLSRTIYQRTQTTIYLYKLSCKLEVQRQQHQVCIIIIIIQNIIYIELIITILSIQCENNMKLSRMNDNNCKTKKISHCDVISVWISTWSAFNFTFTSRQIGFSLAT